MLAQNILKYDNTNQSLQFEWTGFGVVISVAKQATFDVEQLKKQLVFTFGSKTQMDKRNKRKICYDLRNIKN